MSPVLASPKPEHYLCTKVMQEPMIELRQRSIPLSSYIDEGHTAASTYGRCLRQLLFVALSLSALGAFFNIPKCIFIPVQCGPWLGFEVDTLTRSFQVSESKLAKVKSVLSEALSQPRTSARTLASIAGKLISMSPAMLAASLHSLAVLRGPSGAGVLG